MNEMAGNMMGEQRSVENVSNQAADQSVARSPRIETRAPQTPGTGVSELRHHPNRPQHNGPNLTPRAIAKAEVFVAGDHVVYPTHGVGKVERIAVEEIAGHKLELIHITFEQNRMTLRVPVAKARTAGLRKLASRKLFDDALAVLRGRARVKRTTPAESNRPSPTLTPAKTNGPSTPQRKGAKMPTRQAASVATPA